MESEGALIIWKRSIENLNLQYTHYISDGDTKSYNVLETNNLYGVPIVKHDCVGHCSKTNGQSIAKAETGGILQFSKMKEGILRRKGAPD